jgi:hypothetical protein
LLRFAFLHPSSPDVYFPNCEVASMANDVWVCRIHRGDDHIRSGIFQLDQTSLFRGA